MKFTKAKAWVAGIGTVLTATTTALATVTVVLDDDVVNANEYGALAVAAATLISTVYGVYKVRNKPIPPDSVS